MVIENPYLFKNLKLIKEVKNEIASPTWTWNITNIVKSQKQNYDFLNIHNLLGAENKWILNYSCWGEWGEQT